MYNGFICKLKQRVPKYAIFVRGTVIFMYCSIFHYVIFQYIYIRFIMVKKTIANNCMHYILADLYIISVFRGGIGSILFIGTSYNGLPQNKNSDARCSCVYDNHFFGDLRQCIFYYHFPFIRRASYATTDVAWLHVLFDYLFYNMCNSLQTN